MKRETTDYTCPSAQPDSPDARVFGVVLGGVEEPRVAYLEKGVALSGEAIGAIADVSPTRVLRFAGKCANGACAQFRNGGCSLGTNIRHNLAPVADRIPACTIRATCRWFAENGPEVCLRCSRVVTSVLDGDPVLAPFGLPAAPAAVASG
jgi:hypothetical protein